MGLTLKLDELYAESVALVEQAQVIATNPDATAEDQEKVEKMIADVEAIRARCVSIKTLEDLATAAIQKANRVQGTGTNPDQLGNPYRTMGEFLTDVWKVAARNEWTERVKRAYVTLDDDSTPSFDMKNYGWVETKELTEAVGADGGFTVFPEQRPSLFMLTEFQRLVRERALVLPMKAREVHFPTLDQTGSTSGVANLYGGVIPKWTEESAEKEETQPSFRQLKLIAHKLIVYTEASDELMEDSAVGLEALLKKLFGGAISNEEEWAFINGTGAGQPLGITDPGCGVTLRQTRVAANAISIVDVFNMLSIFMGTSPIWIAHQSTMPQILQLNGPAGNASYVWIGNGRDAMPTTLMGYPIYFIENCQTLGSEGDLILSDWSKYVVGDRKITTIDSSKHFKFRNDLTAWRGVHRVGGRPWLSAPLTLRDGTTQVSPFVILDDAVTS